MTVRYERKIFGVIPRESRMLNHGEEIVVFKGNVSRKLSSTQTIIGQEGPGALLRDDKQKEYRDLLGRVGHTMEEPETRFVEPPKTFIRGLLMRHKVTVF